MDLKSNIELWIDQLRNSDKFIIVEGKKDVAALKKVGITNVRAIDRQPIYSFVEDINVKDVIILTDFDPAGEKLYHSLKHDLQEHGIKIDNYFREFLFKKSKLRFIEGLDTYVKKEKNNV